LPQREIEIYRAINLHAVWTGNPPAVICRETMVICLCDSGKLLWPLI